MIFISLSGVVSANNSVSILFPIKTAPLSQTNVIPLFDQIKKLRAQRQFDYAIQLGQKHLRTTPNDVDVMLLIGLMFYQKKELAEAEQYFKNILVISPNYLDAKLALINIKIAQNQLQQAAALISQATHQAPNDARITTAQASLKEAQTIGLSGTGTVSTNDVISTLLPIKTLPLSQTNTSPIFEKIKKLKAHGQLDYAIQLGQKYLQTTPNDADVMLIIGLIFYQKKEFTEAEHYFKNILVISPNYLDAKLALINIKIAQNQLQQAAALISQATHQAPNDARIATAQASLKEAKAQERAAHIETAYRSGNFNLSVRLAKEYLAIYPRDESTRLFLGHIYFNQKYYQEAKTEFQMLLTLNPKNKDAHLGLIDEELASDHNLTAQRLIKQGLTRYPNDPDFLVRKATLYFSRHQYARSAQLNKKIMAEHPENLGARDLLKEITTLNPHILYGLNEVGANSEIDYISDLHTVWQYSTAYYSYDTPWGLASLSINDATRFGITSNQGALNLYPVINNHLSFRLTAAYANQPLLFPTYVGGIETYFAGGIPLETSFGVNYASILPNIAYAHYTGSLSKEWKQYWLSFRPNYYVPRHGKKSLLYTLTLLRYYGAKDVFARLTAGSGTSPDLANLTTVDFIVIKNNYVTFNIQFPVINHSFLLNIGGDYQHWVFPSQRVRNISGMTIGFSYRFQGIRK